jgi:hypothetical protein
LARFIADDDRDVSDSTTSLDHPGVYSFKAGYCPGTSIKLYRDLWATTDARAGPAGGTSAPQPGATTARPGANIHNQSGQSQRAADDFDPGPGRVRRVGQRLVPDPAVTRACARVTTVGSRELRFDAAAGRAG